jgi:hypothetical protein
MVHDSSGPEEFLVSREVQRRPAPVNLFTYPRGETRGQDVIAPSISHTDPKKKSIFTQKSHCGRRISHWAEERARGVSREPAWPPWPDLLCMLARVSVLVYAKILGRFMLLACVTK